MARGPAYVVKYRRRREGKTDYRARRKLVLSGLPRLVVRFSLKNGIAQVVEAGVEGDRVVASASSKELQRRFGWLGSGKNTPAAYLLGLLIGLKALEKGVKKAVLDIGLRRATKGARWFAALKGAVDAGLEVPHGEGILPTEDRIRGEHIAEYARMLLEEDPDKYKMRFSKYLERGLRPEELPKHFEEVKARIMEAYGHVGG